MNQLLYRIQQIPGSCGWQHCFFCPFQSCFSTKSLLLQTFCLGSIQPQSCSTAWPGIESKQSKLNIVLSSEAKLWQGTQHEAYSKFNISIILDTNNLLCWPKMWLISSTAKLFLHGSIYMKSKFWHGMVFTLWSTHSNIILTSFDAINYLHEVDLFTYIHHQCL